MNSPIPRRIALPAVAMTAATLLLVAAGCVPAHYDKFEYSSRDDAEAKGEAGPTITPVGAPPRVRPRIGRTTLPLPRRIGPGTTLPPRIPVVPRRGDGRNPEVASDFEQLHRTIALLSRQVEQLQQNTMLKRTAQRRPGAKSVSLRIADGTSLASEYYAIVDDLTGTASNLAIEGFGSELKLNKKLHVGVGGHGNVVIGDGGALRTGPGVLLGKLAEGNGSVAVTGGGSQWRSGGGEVGVFGQGEISLTEGAFWSATGRVDLGAERGSQGRVAVGGANTRWDARAGLLIGRAGRGELRVLNRGTVHSRGSLNIGAMNGGFGEASIVGRGSRCVCEADLTVGRVGYGRMSVLDGGSVRTRGKVAVGVLPSGFGELLVFGPGSSWRSDDVIDVGQAGRGTVGLRDQAVLAARSVLLGRGGQLTGDGLVEAGVHTAGLVEPGGVLQISGDLEQVRGGTMRIRLGESPFGQQVGWLEVSGVASLSGKLELLASDGFSPVRGMRVKVLSAQSLHGQFDQLELPPLPGDLRWQENYGNREMSLTIVMGSGSSSPRIDTRPGTGRTTVPQRRPVWPRRTTLPPPRRIQPRENRSTLPPARRIQPRENRTTLPGARPIKSPFRPAPVKPARSSRTTLPR